MAGPHARFLPNRADEDQFNIRTRAVIGDPDAIEQLDPNDPANIPAEAVKAAHQAAQLADQHTQDVAARAQTADVFIAGRPEFVDNKHNADLMTSTLKAMYGDVRFSLDMYENAYAHLFQAGLLQLNQTELKKRKAADNKQRYDNERARVEASRFDENSDYNQLSLDQIKQLADDAMRKDMQLQGERGGNGF